jgi:hypothetical protein
MRHDDLDEAKCFFLAWVVICAFLVLIWWGK